VDRYIQNFEAHKEHSEGYAGRWKTNYELAELRIDNYLESDTRHGRSTWKKPSFPFLGIEVFCDLGI
jgi:hypothetical protein